MTALFEMRIRVGGDPRGLGEFTVLRDELAKLSHPACPAVDWVKVEQLCLTLFQNNGADLQTAASFALARSHCYGLEGMAQGVTLIEVLCSEWTTVWPLMHSMRMGILAWLFAQWQPLLRSLEVTQQTLSQLARLGAELDRLAAQLDRRGQVSLVSLQALRHQIASLMQRLQRNVASGEMLPALPMLMRTPEPAFVVSVIVLPAQPMPELPPAANKTYKRSIVLWLFALLASIALGVGFWWWSQAASPPQPVPDTVHLDSLSLFDAGSSELKPESTKVLINALVNIKAQPGWLIVIVGHADTTGDSEQNLQLSYARASAVRDWMQRMGDLADNCFAVQAAAGKQPIASNDTASGRAANRRVDIRLMPQAQACAPASIDQ